MRQTGYTENELLALTPTAIKPYHTEAEFSQLLQPLINGGEPSIVFQTYHRHKKGHEIAVEIFLQYIKLEDVGASFGAIVRDITDRNLAEQALKESEERFRILARHAPVGILRADQTGACTFINERWSKITGNSEAEAINDGWSLALHPADTPLVRNHWHNLVTRSIPFDPDYRFLHKNGTEVWVEAKAIGVFDSNQDVTGFPATITDISERRRLEQTLQDTQKLESLGLLAAALPMTSTIY
ncbi:MAG: PAS domain S-box-containing protein [Pseudohongiellaceae bacterium]